MTNNGPRGSVRLAWRLLVLGVLATTGVRPAAAINLQFNYLFDDLGFFDDPVRRATLEAAGDFFEKHLIDTLSPIVPTGFNSWSVSFSHPATGNQQALANVSVPADTLLIYAGGRSIDGVAIGIGGPGGYSASGTQNWLDTISRRGEGTTGGASAVDFAPWGGSITFDSTKNWHAELDSNPSFGENDLFSVALHELAHVLGFGSAPSFDADINHAQGTFTGVYASLDAGGPIDLAEGVSHWASGTTGVSFATGLESQATMTPEITVGSRKYFTSLDLAGLRDIGWTLSSAGPPLAGDVDGNRIVDLSDFNVLKTNFGSGAMRSQGDLNADFEVNLADFNVLKENFGARGAVPEPSTLALAVVAAAAWSFGRSRRIGRPR